MKTKLFTVLVMLLQTSLSYAWREYNGNSATQVIKTEVAKKFNNWLIKGEFEKTAEYEARIVYANDTLSKITQDVISQIKNYLLSEIYPVTIISYNADEEIYLMKIEYSGIRDNKIDLNYDYDGIREADSIILKISPKYAKYFSKSVSEGIGFYPLDVQIMNDKWIFTKGVIAGCTRSTTLRNLDKIEKVENEYCVHKEYTFDLKTTNKDIDQELKNGFRNSNFYEAWFLFEWNITDQSSFNPATIKSVKINLEELNITLPTATQPIVIDTEPQVADLNMKDLQTTITNPNTIVVAVDNSDYLAIKNESQVKIEEIKVGDYKYPNVLFSENNIANAINYSMISSIDGFESLSNDSLSSSILKQKFEEKEKAFLLDRNGLSSVTYQVCYNNEDILSIAINTDWISAYLTTNSKYFNFDLKTGYLICINQIFDSSKTLELRNLIATDITNRLKISKKSFPVNDWNDFLKEYWNKAYENVDIHFRCGVDNEVNLNNFKITQTGITFYITTLGLPHVVQCYEPSTEYNYSWSTLKPYLLKWSPLTKVINKSN